MATAQDSYLRLLENPLARDLAGRLGLPRPARLRRYRRGEPLIPGPVLVIGTGGGADTLAAALLAWDLDVRRHPVPGERLGAIVAALDELAAPGDLAGPALAIGASLRELAPGGRVVTVSRPAAGEPAVAASRQAVQGLLRSLARELRGGVTGNGILLGEGVDAGSPGVQAALRFLLSARSAYVDGQFLLVGSGDGTLPEDPDRPLGGKVAAVTGGARGIGAAIAEVLRRDGANVIAIDVPAAGEQLAAVANRIGATALQLDITVPEAGNRILAHAGGRYGRLDIVVHNAGITRDKLLANMDAERWNAVLEVNLAAQLRMNEAFLASDLLGPAPRIVCLASTSGIAGNRGQTNYAASKAGVIGMVQALAPALAGRGGTVNAVAPGFIETDMTARIPAATREVARRLLPSLQQGGQPVDVAEAVAFLAGGAAGINGQTLRVCGQSLVGA
ncbi:3-oxoacyl-ACP reductase [Arthrobacter deserti]|uniref:3-oxoacyl-ACP reductase n=1 Tax=Arthrobacter deserti TaxID=1742687 RepID=A0ABX1JLU1_9MICC|nr:3-oxoacyl-ACP reductase [Arthrobacter deserti]